MKVWLDCDPGHDDMLAIVMAACSEAITLLGISTSSGNSTIENTTRNTLNILHEIGRDDVQVVRGASRPLCRALETAPDIHGESGL
jgi:inosine-uridine nucleoside N-ribohydrolase